MHRCIKHQYVELFCLCFVSAGHSECVRHLLWHGASVDIADIKAQTPLFVAIKNRHIDCVRALLEAGANPDGNQSSLCSPAYIAAMDGFADGISVRINYSLSQSIGIYVAPFKTFTTNPGQADESG